MESNLEIAQSFFRQNKYLETINTCNKILATNANSIEALKLIAKSFLATRKIADARLYLNKGLTIKPEDCELIKDLGNSYQAVGDVNTAKNYYQKAIAINSSYAPALTNLGSIELNSGNKQEALSLLTKATESDPQLARSWENLANGYLQLGKTQQAEIACRKSIKLNPNLFNSHFLLGMLLIRQKKLQEAKQPLRKTIELNPNFFQAHHNLGVVLQELGQLQEAELSTRKAIKLNPDFAEAYLNLGTIFKIHGNLQEAEVSVRKAIELNPDFAEAYFNLSLTELLKGNYQSGLDNFEFRFKTNNPIRTHSTTKLKRIDNRKLPAEKSLLVISEGGLGDTLQNMRYIPYLRNQDCEIYFCAQEKLHSLIKASNIDPHPLTPTQAKQISYGEWIPLLSLPRHLQVNPSNPIVSKPYISTTQELITKWKNILSTEKRPIIGIQWQGNPDNEKTTLKGRSFPLETFYGIAKNHNLQLLSLQKGFGSEQLNHCSFKNKFVKCQAEIDSTWDFLDNAAIIANCDLIITCDSSIAHLAGGMGQKVWLLLKDIPYWVWGLEGESTFWYPSMRLFRQKERHNWQEVMERVSMALSSLEDEEQNLI